MLTSKFMLYTTVLSLVISIYPIYYFYEFKSPGNFGIMMKPTLSYDLKAPGVKKAIVFFFIKLAIVFTSWFFIYTLLLSPSRIIDRPLTNFITKSVVKSINFLSPSTSTISWTGDNDRNYLIRNNIKVFGIFDVCNGIDLIFTYVSVLFLLPYPLLRKIIFSLGGIVVIISANIIRVVALYFIYVSEKNVFDFSHHYLFTIFIDILIFCGWLMFINTKRVI